MLQVSLRLILKNQGNAFLNKERNSDNASGEADHLHIGAVKKNYHNKTDNHKAEQG